MATYVLLHGAYQGGWIWTHVAERLERDGHRVLRPTLDGCAEREVNLRPGITTETHAEEVARLLFYEDLSQVIMVGTSSGGMVLCRAAELAGERIERLVFVDALALDRGERIGDIVDRPPAAKTALATGPTPDEVQDRLFVDLEPAMRRWAGERVTKHPLAVMEEPVWLDDFWSRTWSADVIYCSRGTNPPRTHQQRTASRLGATWTELDTGHYPMLSTPDELSGLLLSD